MRFFRSYKKYDHKYGLVKVKPSARKPILSVVFTLITAALLIGVTTPRLYDAARLHYSESRLSKINPLHWKNLPLLPHSSPKSASPTISNSNFSHTNITSTIFWVGEGADASNGYISNKASAWDENWLTHYGGLDDPGKRSGFRPAAFAPKENPFYVALPYNDITESSTRKSSATNCLSFAASKLKNYSWCKNVWVIIRHGQKTVYAQWEDVGPFEEDNLAYVFGKAAPKNSFGAHAGIDVSPAVRDYLGLSDIDKVDWSFVASASVPKGPWQQTITTSVGSSLN